MADLKPPSLAVAAAADVDAEKRATVTLSGREFLVADRIGGMAILKFAKMASNGVDSSSLAGMAAMFDLLKAVIDPAEWASFEQHAEDERTSADDLLEAVFDAMNAMTERPTAPPSDSSGGRPTTSASSAGVSSSRAIAGLEAQERGDLALLVRQSSQALAS